MSSVEHETPAAESVRVNIFGQTYSLRSPQGGERVRRVAEMVDGRMREIASQLAVHDAAKVAVMAALNLADELELVREHYEREIESLLTSGPEPPNVESHAGVPAGAGAAADDEEGRAVVGAQGAAGAPQDAAAGARTDVEEAGATAPSGGPSSGPEARAEGEAANPSAAGGGGTQGPAGGAGEGEERGARRSWFDEIFDTEFSPGGGPGRLSSQVSTRLQRLRQATREGSISDGDQRED